MEHRHCRTNNSRNINGPLITLPQLALLNDTFIFSCRLGFRRVLIFLFDSFCISTFATIYYKDKLKFIISAYPSRERRPVRFVHMLNVDGATGKNM